MDKKMRLIWWGVLGLLLAAAAVKFLSPVKSPVKVEQSEGSREIVIYITGAVQHPGLLHLPIDARLDDALKQAAPSANADLEALNPAQRLKDGQKVIVPFREQQRTGPTSENLSPANSTIGSSVQKPAKVNINSAGIEELDKLPGIGPAIAQRIIDYRRQNGLFSSPEEIQKVSGIGAKTYEKIAEYISVGP